MTAYGLIRIVGVAVIALLGTFVGLIWGETAVLLVSSVYQILNTAMLFILVSIAYEWSARQR